MNIRSLWIDQCSFKLVSMCAMCQSQGITGRSSEFSCQTCTREFCDVASGKISNVEGQTGKLAIISRAHSHAKIPS